MQTDAFDLCPQFNRWYPNHYATYAVNQLSAILLQQAAYLPRFAAVPADNSADIAARRTVESLVAIEPGSIVWAIAGYSEQTEGFKVQITEANAEKFFQTPVRFAANPADAITGRIHILCEPRLVVGPVTAQLSNMSTSANQVQVVLFYAEPRAGQSLSESMACYKSALQELQAAMQTAQTAQQQRTAHSIPFREANPVDTPAAGTGPQLVLSFRCADGQDGLIRSLSCQYTNPSLIEGSGDIVWRIVVDGAYVKGYDNITTTLGSAAAPMELQGAIPVSSGQLVEFYVEHATGSSLPASGTQIICTAAGQYFPR